MRSSKITRALTGLAFGTFLTLTGCKRTDICVSVVRNTNETVYTATPYPPYLKIEFHDEYNDGILDYVILENKSGDHKIINWMDDRLYSFERDFNIAKKVTSIR